MPRKRARKMKIPKKVNVMGVQYHIRLEKNLEDNGQSVWGYTEFQSALIVLRRGMNKQKTMQTLIHELTHAMLHEIGNEEHEMDETLVNPLGNVLYQVLKENDLSF